LAADIEERIKWFLGAIVDADADEIADLYYNSTVDLTVAERNVFFEGIHQQEIDRRIGLTEVKVTSSQVFIPLEITQKNP